MKLILFSHPYLQEEELTVLSEMGSHGIAAFHLRKPGWNQKEIEHYLTLLPLAILNKTVIHGHYVLAEKFKVKGIHLPESQRANFLCKKLVLPENVPLISTSFHSYFHLISNKLPFEYVILSPVFDSISKKNHQAGFQLAQLQYILPKVKYNVVALGGVNQTKIPICVDLGFKGVAVLGAVWESSEPLLAIRSLQQSISYYNR